MQTTSWRVRDASGWTMFIFGGLALFFGLIGLLKPELVLSTLAFNVVDRVQRAAGDYTLTFVIASSMASFNVGVYYILATLNDVKAFYRWTVPFRAVTFVVFSIAVVTGLAPIGWIGVATWELCGGIATGLALYYERRRPGSVK